MTPQLSIPINIIISQIDIDIVEQQMTQMHKNILKLIKDVGFANDID